MFLLVKQVSKSSATLEWTQNQAQNILFMSTAIAENDLATHTHLGPNHSTNEEVRKADLLTSRRPTPWADSFGDSCYLPLLQVAPAEVWCPPCCPLSQ